MIRRKILRRLCWQCPLLVCFSFGVSLFLLAHFPHKVLGSQFLYDGDSDGLVAEVKSATGSFQTSSKPRVIKFYSPYCGHCVHFKPKYVDVAREVHDKYSARVEFFAVSCAAMAELCQKYKIQAYPSVYAVREGDVSSVNDLTKVKSRGFSIDAVEKALKLNESPLSEAQTRKLAEPKNDDKEEEVEEMNNDDNNEEEEEEASDNEAVNDSNEKNEAEDKKETDNPREDEDEEEQHTGAPDEEEDEEEQTSAPDEEEEDMESDSEDEDEEPDSNDKPIIRAGADAAKSKKRSMDKWKEIQKQRLREREYLMLKKGQARAGNLGKDFIRDPEGATKAMKANRRGTVEYNERQKQMLEVFKTMKKGKRKKEAELQQMMKAGKIPYRKQISKPRMRERIPVVKRLVKMSSEEELILDASMSFLEGLRIGVFKSMEPLSNDRRAALKDWLELLQISLPSEWALRDTISDLLNNFGMISENPKGLSLKLNQHPFPRKKWSKSCAASSNSWTCGFWKLLHIMTVGMAEHRGGINLVENGSAKKDVRVFSPMDAAATLRNYMEYFFLCSECSDNFISHYDNCENNRRCDRLLDSAESATDDDWKELANWLWETHNEINVRLMNERADDERKKKRILRKPEIGPGSASMEEEIKVLWPNIDGCIACFNEDGTYNEGNIFIHLEKTYWPGYDLSDTPQSLLVWLDDSGQGGTGLTLLLFIAFVAFIFVSRYVTRSSVQGTMLRAKALGRNVATGGKIRNKM